MNGFKLPIIMESEKTPLVTQLVEIIRQQNEMLQKMRDENARLKGQKAKPTIKPSLMEEETERDRRSKSKGQKRPGSAKREKNKNLEIHRTELLKVDGLPVGAKFQGYAEWVAQDLNISPFNTLYRMEKWKLPDGSYVQAKLPDTARTHFGITLQGYILYQYHQCHVTQPLLLEQLREFGIDISSGQLNVILTEKNELFHEEKNEILKTGIEVSSFIQTDDTGARHDGKNGYCTHIGNDLFAWFKSTESKSRLNFIELMSGGKTSFLINEDSIAYMQMCGIERAPLLLGLPYAKKRFETREEFESHLRFLGIWENRSHLLATEAALLASLLEQGLNRDLVILSDDAGQFDLILLYHALCWVHAERHVHKLIPETEAHRKIQEKYRDQIWRLYRKLKIYKEKPSLCRRKWIELQFDLVFNKKTGYPALNEVLGRIFKNKKELLLVLDRPEIPIHNNGSESDIREYVKRRNVSGSTRSDPGRESRDTFTSLKKTCRKLGISFWAFLQDRLAEAKLIPKLTEVMRIQASLSPAHAR